MCAALNSHVYFTQYGAQAICTGGAALPIGVGGEALFTQITVAMVFPPSCFVLGSTWKDPFWDVYLEEIGWIMTHLGTPPVGMTIDITLYGPQFGTISVPFDW
jgi:hypothetical protein